MFTDRYLKLPIRIVSTKLANMDISERGLDVTMRINPMEISRYYPLSNSENGENITKIEFKGVEDSVAIYLNIDDFEKLLNNHQK